MAKYSSIQRLTWVNLPTAIGIHNREQFIPSVLRRGRNQSLKHKTKLEPDKKKCEKELPKHGSKKSVPLIDFVSSGCALIAQELASNCASSSQNLSSSTGSPEKIARFFVHLDPLQSHASCNSAQEPDRNSRGSVLKYVSMVAESTHPRPVPKFNFRLNYATNI
eukprot:SAG31_NODE_1030_length_10250_cov_2.791942_4_plen_164_part_00